METIVCFRVLVVEALSEWFLPLFFLVRRAPPFFVVFGVCPAPAVSTTVAGPVLSVHALIWRVEGVVYSFPA